jgi:hypothetical protein
MGSISLVTQFFAARISPSLASVRPASMTTPEREQTALITTACTTGGGILDYSIRCPLTPSIPLEFYDLSRKH